MIIYQMAVGSSKSTTEPVKNGDCGCQMVHLGLPESSFAKLTSFEDRALRREEKAWQNGLFVPEIV